MLSAGLSGCGNPNRDIGSSDDIYDRIRTAITLDSRMPALLGDRLETYYGVLPDDVEDFYALLPTSAASAVEIAIIRFKDADKAKAAEAGFERRAEEIMKSFETYIPAQYEVARKYVLSVKGKYLLFLIHEDAEKGRTAFEGMFR